MREADANDTSEELGSAGTYGWSLIDGGPCYEY